MSPTPIVPKSISESINTALIILSSVKMRVADEIDTELPALTAWKKSLTKLSQLANELHEIAESYTTERVVEAFKENPTAYLDALAKSGVDMGALLESWTKRH